MKINSKSVKKDLTKELSILEDSLMQFKSTKIAYPNLFIFINQLSSLIEIIHKILDEDLEDNKNARNLNTALTKKLEEVSQIGAPIGNFLLLSKNNTLDPNFSCAYANVTKSIYSIMHVSSTFGIELINQYNKKTKKRRIALW